jgi:hypothetical protein
MKLKLFEENNEDIRGNKIRYCPNPECKMLLHLSSANLSNLNPIAPEKWNDKRIGILCCNCFKLVECFKKNALKIEQVPEFIKVVKRLASGKFGDDEMLEQRIEGLIRLGLIA